MLRRTLIPILGSHKKEGVIGEPWFPYLVPLLGSLTWFHKKGGVIGEPWFP